MITQYYLLEDNIPATVPVIQINFSSFGVGSAVGWNNTPGSSAQTMGKVFDLLDENNNATAYSLWNDIPCPSTHLNGSVTYAGWDAGVSTRQWGTASTTGVPAANWQISIQGLEASTSFFFEIYASSPSFATDNVIYYQINGGNIYNYNNTWVDPHALLTFTESSDVSGVISINTYGTVTTNGRPAGISGLRFYKL